MGGGGVRSGGGGWGLGGQVGCEQRSEVFVKILKRGEGEGTGWGVRVDVNEELKLYFLKIQ